MARKPPDRHRRSRARIVWRRWGDWRKLIIALLTGAVVATLLTVPLLPDRVTLRPGETAPEPIVAPRTVRYRDEEMTGRLRALVASQVPRVYSKVLTADRESQGLVLGFFEELERQRAGLPGVSRSVERLVARLPEVSSAVASDALKLTREELSAARDAALALVNDAMGMPIDAAQLERRKEQIRRSGGDPALAPRLRRLTTSIAAAALVANRFYNRTETEQAVRAEMERIPVQFVTIRKGDLVMRQGERVTASHLAALVALGLMSERLDLITVSSLVLLAFGLVAVFSLYLYQFHPRVLRSVGSLVLLGLVVSGSLLLFRVGTTALGARFSGEQLGYIGTLCSSLGGMLVAALLCPQIAVFLGVALAILTSVLVGGELKYAIISIVSSLVGVQAVTTIRNRQGILRAAILLAAVNVVTALVAHGVTQANLPDELLQNAAWASTSGFLAVVLFFFLAAWLERPFRLTTPLTLLELSDPSHPLLRRLALEAPGTYHHSVIVGNLSEAAAEAIGADGLFCRVASYYHDIGKVIRPHFFIENQTAGNRHDSINPSLSSLIVASHVKDGVELAEEYRLPPPLIAIIREHHGTCLIKYFYHQAVTGGEDSTPALESQFRYEGPRPQSKESGIIMIADSSEAASRTLQKPTPGRIRQLIERIVRDRLNDGQLDECDLTFKDLDKIVTSMTRTLSSMLHARVEYPPGDTQALRRLGADGTADHEPVGPGKALADTPETASGHPGQPLP